MHPVRRRKKRPNYGVRTVELNRGKNGFGFTISGQQPCILSCIVAGSPAERAGLRPGDYLVAVNGQSVSKIPHDDVVRLIGSSFGILKLQIAESYYSDSSDEDVLTPTRPKPKHLLKPRIVGPNRPVSTPTSAQQNRAAKVVRDLRTGAMFVEQELEDVDTTAVVALARPNVNKATLGVLPLQWDPPVILPPPPPRLYPNILPDKVGLPEIDQVEYRALVGYLGTIEMPKELQPGSRLQIVRSCIRKLRAEKRAHTLVLMSIRTNSLVLTNSQEATLAKYPVERVTFCGSGSDDQKRFFGLVTAAIQEPDDNDSSESVPSSSCHVFAVELRLHGSHTDHAVKAESFKIQCTTDAATGLCKEFPSSSDAIVAAVKILYCRTRDVEENPDEEPLVANSPQPSNSSSTTTTASSNSDSGIGFRDDCGNQSDRILMVDVQNQRLHIQQMVNNDPQEVYNGAMNPPKSCKYDFSLPIGINRSNQCVDDGCSSRLTVRAMPDPVSLCGTAVSSRSRSPLSSTSSEDETLNKLKIRRRVYNEQTVSVSGYNFESYHSSVIHSNLPAKSNDEMSISSGTNKSEDRMTLSYQPKLSTDFTTKTSTPINFAGRYYDKSDIQNISYTAFAGLQRSARSTDAMSVDSTQSQDPLLSYKLSPKVFGLSRPVATHSLEDLKAIGVCPMAEGEASNTTNSCMSVRVGQQWGSLQELRSFVANCFEASPAAEHVHTGHETSAEPEESEKGVASWSTSFEKLLEDPAGLHTFAEFLKKEFSHENIYFWVACEKYRELTSEEERKLDAKAIFDRHLCLGALEPVNVDSHARQVTQESVDEASQTLFLQAQKQIFNLMKFDSYPRFIKSDLYKECLLRQLSGQQLPFPGGEQLDAGLQLHSNKDKSSAGDHKLKKSRSDAEDHRRKSLLPWHRKNRSKSKDRGESDYHMKRTADDTISTRSDVSSSRSSLASWDLALRGSFSRQSIVSGEGVERALCRVILPDGATTVVQTRPNEAVRDLVLRLLDKRGLNYSAFQVFTPESIRPICLDDESCILGSKEVRVEQRVVFRLDLPNRKTVGIKAKPTKTLAEVLKPILHKYGYQLDLVTVCLMSENEVLELNLPVVAVDNQRLQVLTRSADSWKNDAKLKAGPTLDEITNRVFEELLQGKADDSRTASDQNSVKSEDWGSEHSSGIFGRFLRRDSAVHDKSRESRGKNKKTVVVPPHKPMPEETDLCGTASANKPVPITKWKAGVKMQGRADVLSPELYEGLKRAQRSRLEDQRGTEINFELPDFLKDKENAPQAVKKYRKLRKADVETSDQQQPVGSSHESLSTTSKSVKSANRSVSIGNIVSPFLDQSFSDGIMPTPRRAEEYFLGRSEGMPLITCKTNVPKNDSPKSADSSTNSNSLDNTVINASAFNATLTCDDLEGASGISSTRPHSDPPPLPPKPKHLPIKASLWNNVSSIPNHPPTFRIPQEITNNNSRFVRPNEVKRDPKICRSRRAVYLDQPSSSFV